ncbi:hypothetical protein GCM10009609_08210 [Pseudonocardia aurantiaca]|uniref:Uncharacterized protein n=1 Tax=Pseudonocardia aurantiaca TaxID=75290 RepID=A0ABW4FKT4_9PSEU
MSTATTTRRAATPPQAGAAPRVTAIPSTLRHGATLAWRGIIKTVYSPEALIDVTLQPVILLRFRPRGQSARAGAAPGGDASIPAGKPCWSWPA